MALKSRNLPPKCWQIVLPDALTPRERLFNFARRSTAGGSVPTWLCTPGPVLLKRHVRHSKAEPLVDQVELLQADPQYAHVRYPDGRETTVSLRHLAPAGELSADERLTQPEVPASVDSPCPLKFLLNILREMANLSSDALDVFVEPLYAWTFKWTNDCFLARGE